jgi:hypothetical protein
VHALLLQLMPCHDATCYASGWFGAAGLLGGFSREAQGGRVGPAALAALKVWAVGVPVSRFWPSLLGISVLRWFLFAR